MILVDAGILGLIDAIDKFDRNRNVQLKSYARFRVRGAILDSLRQMDWSPRALRRQALVWKMYKESLAPGWACSDRVGQTLAEMGISLREFQQLLGDLRGLDLGSLNAASGKRS